MKEQICTDSRCSYGQHVTGHLTLLQDHECDPWPDWARVNLHAVAVEALYRLSGGWTGPATIRALGKLREEMGEAVAPAEVVAEFMRRAS